MKVTKTKDQLLQSFADFQIEKGRLEATIGGASDGESTDPDGCTNKWIDLSGGGYCHMDDKITVG
jgi:hypothetical protein